VRLLLDSHVGLWWLDDHPSLGSQCRDQLRMAQEVFFSAVTPWELGIKRALGRIVIPDGLADALTACGFTPLPITPAHAERAPVLPPHHRDPFDRMLVAQAQLDALTLVTADDTLRSYDVDLLDARR
jgi:PIN domain nuclease of toxin-antitoxin system